MTITCSTKRSEWERRWGHELPRHWEKGRIQVDGDEPIRIGRYVATILAVAFAISMALRWLR